jgi:hypothetical protein
MKNKLMIAWGFFALLLSALLCGAAIFLVIEGHIDRVKGCLFAVFFGYLSVALVLRIRRRS